MTNRTYSFDISIIGLDPQCDDETFDDVAGVLFEGGLDDAVLAVRQGAVFVSVDREAATALQAVITAVIDVERSDASLEPVRVKADHLVTGAEIAERVGQTAESVRLHATGKRGKGGFPTPVATRPVKQWHWPDVAAWYGLPVDDELADAVEAVNAFLTLRRSFRDAHQPGLIAPLEQAMQGLLARTMRKAAVPGPAGFDSEASSSCVAVEALQVSSDASGASARRVKRFKLTPSTAPAQTPVERGDTASEAVPDLVMA